MASNRKRPVPIEYEDLQSITTSEHQAKVHGVVCSLSPMKPNAKNLYFDGFLTDGTKRMRFVGFSSNKDRLLKSLPVIMNQYLYPTAALQKLSLGMDWS